MIQAADGGVMMWGIFSWHAKRRSKTAYEDYRCQHKLIRSSRWADCKLLIRTSTAEKTCLYTSTIILLINPFLSCLSPFFFYELLLFKFAAFSVTYVSLLPQRFLLRSFTLKESTNPSSLSPSAFNVKHLQEVLKCWKTETQTAD